MANNFCAAPWVSLFYQTDRASVCCTNTDAIKMAPMNFISSDVVKKLKKDFLNNEKPETCVYCWKLEELGNASLRTQINSMYPIDQSSLTEETPTVVKYLELRTSNLCNFACRMCGPINSNQFDREVKENSSLRKYFLPMEIVGEFTTISREQIKNIAKNLDTLYLTGGEPMLIKEYHDILDYLIENNYHEKIMLQITTNGSIFNPKLMEKIVQFKSVRIILSIDGVGEVADYQRHGSDWEIVKQNLYCYLDLPNVDIVINSVSSGYTILDISNLVGFIIDTRMVKKDFSWSLRRAITPFQIDFSLLNEDLTTRALDQVHKSLAKLSLKYNDDDQFFSQAIAELKSYVAELEKNDYINFNDFVEFTKTLDESRNEHFEQVFGYKIY